MVKKLVVVFCALFLGSVACSKRESASAPFDRASQTSAVGAEKVALASARSDPTSASPTQMIVYTGDLRLIVRDTATAANAIQTLVSASGGYLAESRLWREGELLRATLTLRIPPANLPKILESIRNQAKRVEQENLATNDVGGEYVDLQSRLTNLKATEVELRALLTTIRERSRKASEVLEIHQQLTSVRGEIEQLEGRIQYLTRSVSLATIRVELIPDAIATPVVVAGWQPVATFRKASRALVLLLQRGADVTIWTFIYVLPAVLLFVLPVAVIVFVARRLREQRTRFRSVG